MVIDFLSFPISRLFIHFIRSSINLNLRVFVSHIKFTIFYFKNIEFGIISRF